MKRDLESNIWKFFLFILTQRRNYLPILALYFLSLPNSTAQQIGLYTGIGWVMGFALEIPSGYLADKLGHKNALILSKFFMIFSTLFFVFGNSLIYFILGASFMSMGFSISSGTAEAFLHNNLIGLKKEKKYAKIFSRITANASLVSAVMILLLPLFTKISLLMPIKVFLIFDIIGLLTAISLYSPKIKYTSKDIEGEKIFSQIKKFKGTGFYITSIFLGILGGFLVGISQYKEPFAQSLGLPIILMGSMMAFSRFVWFILGYFVHHLKKIEVKKLLFYEIFFFSGAIMLCSQLKNPYLMGLTFAIAVGYYYARDPLLTEYYLNNFLMNKRYKATMLSIRSQFEKIFDAVVVFSIGFVMQKSFSLGFLVSGISMLVLLLITYCFIKKRLK